MAIMFTFSFLLFATVGETVVTDFAFNVNLSWWLAVKKVVNCVLLLCAHHLAKATLRTPNIITILLTVSMSKQCTQF
jgi:hypothetical protein